MARFCEGYLGEPIEAAGHLMVRSFAISRRAVHVAGRAKELGATP